MKENMQGMKAVKSLTLVRQMYIHPQCMEFTCDRSIPDKATSTLQHVAPSIKKSDKYSKNNVEEAKVKLWEALAEKLSKAGTTHGTKDWQQSWQDGFQAGFQQLWQQGFMQMQTMHPNNNSPMFHSFAQPTFRGPPPSSQYSNRSISPRFSSCSTSPEMPPSRSPSPGGFSSQSSPPAVQSFQYCHPPELLDHSPSCLTDLVSLMSTQKYLFCLPETEQLYMCEVQ